MATDFPGLYTIQRGFGGAELSDVIRYAPRIVLPYRPRLIVLYAGENDLAAGKSAMEVFREYQAFVTLVRRTLPETRIVFVSIKPSPSRWALADQMREANGLIRRHGINDPRLSFVDVFTPMLGPDGKPREELFVADRLHMNERGYRLWTEILRPILQKWVDWAGTRCSVGPEMPVTALCVVPSWADTVTDLERRLTHN